MNAHMANNNQITQSHEISDADSMNELAFGQQFPIICLLEILDAQGQLNLVSFTVW